MIMPTKITIFLLAMILCINIGQGSNVALEVLGFQQWQQPSAQQIKAQYKQLTENYNKNENKDVEAVQKYEKIKKAYQELSQKNFMLGEERRQRNNMFNQRQRPRRGRPGYYHQYETFKTDNFHFESSDTINWDQIFNDIDFTFMGSEKGKTKVTFDFLDFLMKNPLVVLAAFLISLGVLNLCTCCCCCCCRCCRRRQQQAQKEKEENGQPKRQQLSHHQRVWLQRMKKSS